MKKLPERIDVEMKIDFPSHFRSSVRSILLTREFTPNAEMTIDWWADLFTDVFEEAMRVWNDGVRRFEERHPELQEDDDEELVESGELDEVEEDEDAQVLVELFERITLYEERIEVLENALRKIVGAAVFETLEKEAKE